MSGGPARRGRRRAPTPGQRRDPRGGHGGPAGKAVRSAGGPDALWQPEAHPVLFRAGPQPGGQQAGRVVGDLLAGHGERGHPAARPGARQLAGGQGPARRGVRVGGPIGDAIAMFAGALGDRERSQGPEHPDTIAARRLAHAYSSAGLPAEAVALYEHMVADASRQLGPGTRPPWPRGPDWPTLTPSRPGQPGPGRLPDGQRRLRAAARARRPNTLTARDNLAAALLANGRAGGGGPLQGACWPTTRRRAGRIIPTRSRPAPAWPRPTAAAGSQGRDRALPAGAGRPGAERPAPITRTRSRPGPTWPSPTAAPGSCGRPSPPTSGRWPTGSGLQGPDHPDTRAARAQPGRRLPAGRAARPTPCSSTSRRWPTRADARAGRPGDAEQPGPAWPRPCTRAAA